MRRVLFILLSSVCLSLAQDPFNSLEGAVGYMVVEKSGRIENYVVVENKDGSVKAIRVDRNPAQFMKKTDEPREGGRR